MSTTIEKTSTLQSTLHSVIDSAEFQTVLAQIRGGARVVSISGLVAEPARALLVAAMQRETGKQFALVVPAQRDLESWQRDVRFWYCALHGISDCEEAVAVLPASESDPYAGGSPHAETLERRALALWRLARTRPNVVLLTSRALARRTVAPPAILKAGAMLLRDEDHPPEELVDKLIAAGYVREDPVGAVGEFSMRGGILDVWPPGRDAPGRIEFFGDTVDSIREFDPETQLSTTQLTQIEIPPMRELIVRTAEFREWASHARMRWRDERFARSLRDRTIYADEGESFPGWEWLISLGRENDATTFDYLKDAVLVVDEPVAVETYLSQAFQTVADRYAETDAVDDLGLRPEELYLTPEELRAQIDRNQRVEFRVLGRTAAKIDQELALDAEQPKISVGKERAEKRPLFLFPNVSVPGAVVTSSTSRGSHDPVAIAPGTDTAEIDFKAQSVMRYHGRIPDLARDVIDRHGNGATTLFVMPSTGVAERVAEILREYEVNARLTSFEDDSAAAPADASRIQ